MRTYINIIKIHNNRMIVNTQKGNDRVCKRGKIRI